MPEALQVVWNLVRDKNANGKFEVIKKMDKVLGLNLLKKEETAVPQQVKRLIKQREKFRKDGNFNEADEIRKKINNLGFVIEDTKKGAVVKKK